MKKTLAIPLIIILGFALGVGVAMSRLKASPWNPALDEGETAAPTLEKDGKKPAKKVGQIGHTAVLARFCGVE